MLKLCSYCNATVAEGLGRASGLDKFENIFYIVKLT